jgi:hypothetical protein
MISTEQFFYIYYPKVSFQTEAEPKTDPQRGDNRPIREGWLKKNS